MGHIADVLNVAGRGVMIEYRFLKCPMCGVHYAVDETIMAWKQNAPSTAQERGWSCPNGHSLIFKTSEADKQRQRAERAEQNVEYERQRSDRLERSVSAHKGQITKLKQRAKAGVCTCCNRTFQNLARHMKSKHPGMNPEEPLKMIEGGKT